MNGTLQDYLRVYAEARSLRRTTEQKPRTEERTPSDLTDWRPRPCSPVEPGKCKRCGYRKAQRTYLYCAACMPEVKKELRRSRYYWCILHSSSTGWPAVAAVRNTAPADKWDTCRAEWSRANSLRGPGPHLSPLRHHDVIRRAKPGITKRLCRFIKSSPGWIGRFPTPREIADLAEGEPRPIVISDNFCPILIQFAHRQILHLPPEDTKSLQDEVDEARKCLADGQPWKPRWYEDRHLELLLQRLRQRCAPGAHLKTAKLPSKT